MAVAVNLQQNTLLATGYDGFSWTTLFFGCLVPLWRGDWPWFAIMLLAQVLTVGLASLVFCFVYNRIYTRSLLEKGYLPSDNFAKDTLVRRGLLKA